MSAVPKTTAEASGLAQHPKYFGCKGLFKFFVFLKKGFIYLVVCNLLVCKTFSTFVLIWFLQKVTMSDFLGLFKKSL